MGCLLSLALLAGCSSDDEIIIVGPPAPGDNASVAFEHDGTLKLAPREIAEIAVVTYPPDNYALSFVLVGDAFESSLEQSQVIADESGRATVRLHAPNLATSFAVRATVDGGDASAELSVAVSALGFGSLDVEPVYMGSRSTNTWEARVVSGRTCEALADSFPTDPPGALKGTAARIAHVVIPVAPVGPNLAVFVRGGHFMWGCSDVADLVANESHHVQVHIADKPVDTSNVLLDLNMAFSPEQAPYNAIVQNQLALLLGTFMGNYATVGAMLDDTMMQLSSNPGEYQAANQNWAAQIQTNLDANNVDLAATLTSMSAIGMASQQPELVGNVESIGEAPGQVLYTLVRLGSIDVARLGVPAEYLTTLTVDTLDQARLGGTLFWLPTRYFGAVIEDEALAQTSQANMTAALGELAHCNGLQLSYGSCGVACMQQLCALALGARWGLALDASAQTLQVGELPFQASGQSQIDDDANLQGFEGTWLGEMIIGSLTAKVQGAVSALPGGGPPAN